MPDEAYAAQKQSSVRDEQMSCAKTDKRADARHDKKGEQTDRGARGAGRNWGRGKVGWVLKGAQRLKAWRAEGGGGRERFEAKRLGHM